MNNPQDAARNSAKLQGWIAETELDKQSAEIAYLRADIATARQIIEQMMQYAGSMGEIDWERLNDWMMRTNG
jgi:hypothetical protein